jgi:iron-sulfur cluster assembly accessory protein
MSITVTKTASKKIKEFLKSENIQEGAGLSIRVKPGGCSGFEYVLELGQHKEGLKKFGEDENVFVDDISLPYLDGSEIDFVESIQGAGFDIKNPNTKSSCGCGSSFGV